MDLSSISGTESSGLSDSMGKGGKIEIQGASSVFRENGWVGR